MQKCRGHLAQPRIFTTRINGPDIGKRVEKILRNDETRSDVGLRVKKRKRKRSIIRSSEKEKWYTLCTYLFATCTAHIYYVGTCEPWLLFFFFSNVRFLMRTLLIEREAEESLKYVFTYHTIRCRLLVRRIFPFSLSQLFFFLPHFHRRNKKLFFILENFNTDNVESRKRNAFFDARRHCTLAYTVRTYPEGTNTLREKWKKNALYVKYIAWKAVAGRGTYLRESKSRLCFFPFGFIRSVNNFKDERKGRRIVLVPTLNGILYEEDEKHYQSTKIL